MNEEGKKFDNGKPRMSLFPIEALKELLAVLEYGAMLYGDNNWKKVQNWESRYYNAAMRHIFAWWCGETEDLISKKHPLAHAICSLLFILDKELEQECKQEDKVY